MVAPGAGVEIVNADEIARALPRDDFQAAVFEARQLAAERMERLLAERSSFGYETTLHLKEDLRFARRAAAAGYRVEAVLIWSGRLQTSMDRVALRVARKTGHHVPPDEIRHRYERAVEALAVLVGAADLAMVLDNSRTFEEGPRLVLQARAGFVEGLADAPPDWLVAAFGRWNAPLELGADLGGLGRDPRVYRAQRLLEARRSR